MAQRIFPTKAQEERLDSELVYSGINWDNFGERLAAAREAEGAPLSDEVRDYLKTLQDDDESPEEEKVASTAKRAKKTLPKELEKFQFGKGEEETEEQEEEQAVEATKIVRGKEASSRVRKVHFASASQLSADAIEAAVASGDKELVNTILAARNDHRKRLAAKIEQATKDEMERTAKIAKRNAYRMALVESVEATEKKIAEASQKATVTRVASTTKNESDGFVKVSDLDNNNREAFIRKAQAAGFPMEYVQAMLGTETQPEALSIEGEKVKSVMSSELPKEVKVAAVEGLVRVATLTEGDYDRLKKYWKEELGYGDEEWIDDLFTKKYDK